MDRERYERIREVYERALGAAPGERGAMLDELCAGDGELRREVEGLLAIAERTLGGGHPLATAEIAARRAVMEGVIDRESETSAEPASRDGAGEGVTLAPGTVVGRFRIERVLGVGGMGTVYAAAQERPSRTVALKLIRPGFATPKMLRRFEVESEILGRLSHPGIAPVYDAGVAETAHGTQPYFAMEMVEGVPLTRYAEEKELGTRERLELIARVSDAVEHAHQKGVIHRDLKPGNILVDASGQPKVLDFGVARATDADIATTTMQTDVGALIGTVPYMSPEQAGGDTAALDTRSDVYALGVVAYQLLAGRLPYDLSNRMIHEAVRVIREEEPTRLSSINRTLRGDVETIVGKALEKEPSRRYQSASDFAEDVRRYLHDEPISARPPSAVYQLRKFSRRNKALVGGAAAVFAVLFAGIVATSWQAVEATRARDEAETNLARAGEAEAEAELRAAELEQVAQFQSEQLRAVDPASMGLGLRDGLRERLAAVGGRRRLGQGEIEAMLQSYDDMVAGADFTGLALEILESEVFVPALEAVDRLFDDQPVIRAHLLQTVAETASALGLLELATKPQARALDILRRELGDDHADTLKAMSNTALLMAEQGQPDEEAESLAREALEGLRRALGDDHPDTLSALGNLGSIFYSRQQASEAEPFYREALEMSRRVRGDDHPNTLTLLNDLGNLMEWQGQFEEAETLFREALEVRRRVAGDDHPETLFLMSNFGVVLRKMGKLSEAEALAQQSLEGNRRVLGDDHPNTLQSINNMGLLLKTQGRSAEAVHYYREAIEGYERVLGAEHPSTIASRLNLGNLLRGQGRLDEAEPYFLEALEVCRRTLGADHPLTLVAIGSVGLLLESQDRLSEAEPYYRETLESRLRTQGADHPHTLIAIRNLGDLLRAQGRLAEAEEYYRQALDGRRRVLGDEHPSTLSSLHAMGSLRRDQDRLVEAERYYRSALEPRRRVLGEEHPHTLDTMRLLSATLVGLGRFAEAESLALEVEVRRRALHAPSDDRVLEAMESLAALYDAWHEAEPDKGYGAKAAEWRDKLLPDEDAPGDSAVGD